MLPDKRLNIYPKNEENIQALIDFYFLHYNINQEGAIQKMKGRTSLSLNQLEFIIKKLSEAFVPIFMKHLTGRIALTNLFAYGIDAIEEVTISNANSKSRRIITQELIDFVKQTELHGK